MARPSSFNREDALSSARDLFWRKGFHATSLKDIEAALSLKPGSIYAAFGSKKDLFAEALEHYSEGVQAEFQTYVDAAGSPLDALISYVRNITASRDQCVPSNACMIFKTTLELADEESDLKQLANARLSGMASLFAQAFALAQEKGEISQTVDPHRAALQLQASITGARGMIEGGLSEEDIDHLREDIVFNLERLRVG